MRGAKGIYEKEAHGEPRDLGVSLQDEDLDAPGLQIAHIVLAYFAVNIF